MPNCDNFMKANFTILKKNGLKLKEKPSTDAFLQLFAVFQAINHVCDRALRNWNVRA